MAIVEYDGGQGEKRGPAPEDVYTIGHTAVAMLSLRGKALATVAIVGLNLLVVLFVPWFVVLTAVPSAVLLWAILRR